MMRLRIGIPNSTISVGMMVLVAYAFYTKTRLLVFVGYYKVGLILQDVVMYLKIGIPDRAISIETAVKAVYASYT